MKCWTRVRGRREIPLETLRAAALETKWSARAKTMESACYPGFQSYWCAQYFLDSGVGLGRHLDTILATLGGGVAASRLWEDTLVLLSGLMDGPDRLLQAHLVRQQFGSRRTDFSGG
jgi:hypothetical protein